MHWNKVHWALNQFKNKLLWWKCWVYYSTNHNLPRIFYLDDQSLKWWSIIWNTPDGTKEPRISISYTITIALCYNTLIIVYRNLLGASVLKFNQMYQEANRHNFATRGDQLMQYFCIFAQPTLCFITCYGTSLTLLLFSLCNLLYFICLY